MPTTVINMTGPGTATYDQTAVTAAISGLTSVTTANLKLIHGAICQSVGNTGDIATQLQAISKSLSNIEIALGTVATATNNQTVILAAQASNQIKANNFQIQATKDALARTGQPAPVLPSPADQLKETITEASVLQGAAVAQGAILKFAGDSVGAMGTWIAETETYSTVSKWLKDTKNSIFNIQPPTPKASARAVAAAAGDPTPK